jgi:hypothetical protein
MGSRLTWSEIRQRDEYRGRWIALDECQYDAKTAQPSQGTVVDVDEDLVSLCNRMQESGNRHCAILYCDDADVEPPPSARPIRITPMPGRQYTH